MERDIKDSSNEDDKGSKLKITYEPSKNKQMFSSSKIHVADLSEKFDDSKGAILQPGQAKTLNINNYLQHMSNQSRADSRARVREDYQPV